MGKSGSKKTITVGVIGYWGGTSPAQQHTFVGGQVLQNRFEPLVGKDSKGILRPGGAKTWTISPDFKVFDFEIDTQIRFSDGSNLNANDYKRSWEEALRLEPKSANSSLLDLMYRIEGYEKFVTDGHLSGVEVISESRLVVRFREPFRMALDHFNGVRFSAFKNHNGETIGTGPYTFGQEIPKDSKTMKLEPNPLYPDYGELTPIMLQAVRAVDVGNLIAKGTIEAIFNTPGAWLPSDLSLSDQWETALGPESYHINMLVNGTSGRLLSDLHMRQAVQYLILKRVKESPRLAGNLEYFRYDPSIYLPFTAGRLENSEIVSMVLAGEKHVPELVTRSKSDPITLFWDADCDSWMRETLENAGVRLSSNSRLIKENYVSISYKSSEYDLMTVGTSLRMGDPDGVYHILGKNGAITKPGIYRKLVDDLLEEGRSIIDLTKLDEHYQKVSRAVLTEVPFIHLGFSRSVTLYRKDRVRVDAAAIGRNAGRFDIFEAL